MTEPTSPQSLEDKTNELHERVSALEAHPLLAGFVAGDDDDHHDDDDHPGWGPQPGWGPGYAPGFHFGPFNWNPFGPAYPPPPPYYPPPYPYYPPPPYPYPPGR